MLGIQPTLHLMHSTLMRYKFPYNSVSVVHRNQDWGFRVIFDEAVKDKVNENVISNMEILGFSHSFVKCN